MLKTRQTSQRRGVILMVVLAMLTLFAILGLTFVLYANAAADNARIARETETQNRADLDPEMALALFLSQLVYDAPDNETGVYSALRGHSLARTMYGNLDPDATNPLPLNDKPYNGTGPLSYTSPFSASMTLAKDNRYMVNFQLFRNDVYPDPTNGNQPTYFLRDPERLQWRKSLNPIDPNSNATPRGLFTGGFNPSYTYPDHANMFLAVINPVTGQVVMPSFHRPWLFGSLSDTTNPNLTNTEGKYLTLRPRVADMGPGFPGPEDGVYDVKNLDWAPGGNDSIWIDIGTPVITLPDGRKVKMLVAPLILDLDGRVNLNVHGNINGLNGDHAGNQMWGPWEVNLKKILNVDNAANPQEWKRLFLGNSAALGWDNYPTQDPRVGPVNDRISGRYGKTRWPMPLQSLPPGVGIGPHPYGAADWDGILNDTSGGGIYQSPTLVYELPNKVAGNTVAWQAFPYFPPQSYLNGLSGTGYPLNGLPQPNTRDKLDETRFHPQWYNVLRPTAGNRLLPLPGMVSLLRGAGLTAGGTNSEAMTSDLLRLCPTNFSDFATRNLVTTLSMDLDRPGALPYVWDPTDAATIYAFQPGATPPSYPTGKAPISLDLSKRGSTPTKPGEFDQATWRSVLAGLGRVDLNRYLTPYPTPDPIKGFNDGVAGPLQTQFNSAQTDRTNLANDIFKQLRSITGAPDVPSPVVTTGNEYRTNRWLAQLAVNIVDFIDEDEYVTPFNWITDSSTGVPKPYYVYGTELPRVLLNEVYTQYNNDRSDPNGNTTTSPFHVNVWVELLNPLYSPTSWPYVRDKGDALLEFVPTGTGGTQYSIYRILLADPAATVSLDDTGTPTPAAAIKNAGTTATPYARPWKNTAFASSITPLNKNYKHNPAVLTKNDGFYVVGPTGTILPANEDPLSPAAVSPTATADEMSYTVLRTDANVAAPKTTVVLQRLLCPYMPPQSVPTNANYNPYITVDTFDPSTQPNYGRMEARKSNGALVGGGLTMAARSSFGRNQPYAGHTSQLNQQNPKTKQNINLPFHTFFGHNYIEINDTNDTPIPGSMGQTLVMPFDWLVHLDRLLISPAELLHVSSNAPWDLTSKFVQQNALGVSQAQQHRAPWLDESARIHRLLEFVETHSTASGVRPGGRVPGKININTIWDDGRIFRALCDAQKGNGFTDPTMAYANPDNFVDQLFKRIITQRTPGSPTPGQSDISPGPGDRPYWSLATGMATGNDALTTLPRGLNNSILRADTTPAPNNFYDRILDTYPKDGLGASYPPPPAPPAPPTTIRNPYQRFEVLNKLFNNLTTRSNVFAVYLTVGFFEVAKDATGNYVGEQSRPVKLGAEVGKADGRNVRHRMFAIIDRTNLQVWPTFSPGTNVATVQAIMPAAIAAGTYKVVSKATPAAGELNLWLNGAVLPTWSMANPVFNGVNGNTGRPWQIQAGSVIVIDPDTDLEETVTVQPPSAAGQPPQVTLTKQHSQNAIIISRGNPGPWPRYDPRQDTGVVPYFAVID